MRKKSARALIIAVENYPKATGIHPTRLEGTNEAADNFRRWLLETKFEGSDPGEDFLHYCGEAGRAGVTAGTTRNDILDAMDCLVRVGRDRTDEFYLFFSGHGFAFEERRGRRRLDVLLTSDFVEMAKGGRASVLVDDLQEKVQYALGPGDHYYFVDACRNPVSPRDITPLPIDNVWEASNAGLGCVLTLYSTRSGERASTRSGFVAALVDGLRGVGRAKGRVEPRQMAVTFDLLSRYVRARVPDQEPTPANPQGCDGVIRELDPAPSSRCRVRVQDAAEDEELKLVVSDPGGFFPDRVTPFRGGTFEVELPPGDYGLSVVAARGEATFRRIDPAGGGAVDLWDSREVVYRKEPPSNLESMDGDPVVVTASLRLVAPLGTRVLASRVGGGSLFDEPSSAGPMRVRLGPGDYRLEVLERGNPVQRREVTLRPGDDVLVDLRLDGGHAVRDTILRATGNDPHAGVFTVSESLGPFSEGRLGLLLSLLGASRIVAPHGSFERMGSLPLATFDDVRRDESALYVLAALDQDPELPVEVAAGGAPLAPRWEVARPVPGLPGLWELRTKLEAGGHLVSFRAPGRVPISLATHALRNRATLITLSEAEPEADVELEIHQYLLPLHNLQDALMPEEREHLLHRPLDFVRLLWRVQTLFAEKRPVSLPEDEGRSWAAFLQGKWLDPMMGILAAYELVRRGQLRHGDAGLLGPAVTNLAAYFGDLADTQVLARLLGRPWRRPSTPPLVRHGLRAWPGDAGEPPMPIPAERLSFQGMWTAWSGEP